MVEAADVSPIDLGEVPAAKFYRLAAIGLLPGDSQASAFPIGFTSGEG
ncbi:hypothetical protein AB0K48_20030 [Nonomuraea sp. NPDC055795]